MPKKVQFGVLQSARLCLRTEKPYLAIAAPATAGRSGWEEGGGQKMTMEIFVDVRPLLHMNQQLNLATIEVIVVTIELVVVTIELIVVNMHFFR